MIIAKTIKELDAALSPFRESNKTIGFVPTMGALHAGHISLVDLARQHCECVVVSIFVNPTQFAPHEDFNNYPRTENDDVQKIKSAGVDVLFLPSESVIYPDNRESSVKAGNAALGLESDFRPHFFDGVVNVIYRLFQAVKPNVAIFGEKDYQQLQVIREMVETLLLPMQIIGAPIARDSFGLALSSRNAYLSARELEIARQLNVTLKHAAKNGDTETAKKELLSLGFHKIDYIEIWDNRILAAAWLGKTRLIDNIDIS